MNNIEFLGTSITKDLTWTLHTSHQVSRDILPLYTFLIFVPCLVVYIAAGVIYNDDTAFYLILNVSRASCF